MHAFGVGGELYLTTIGFSTLDSARGLGRISAASFGSPVKYLHVKSPIYPLASICHVHPQGLNQAASISQPLEGELMVSGNRLAPIHVAVPARSTVALKPHY